jgi:hypothetical protein
MFALALERLFQPDAGLDVSQHGLVCFSQSWQQFSNFDQFLSRNHHYASLGFV